MPTDSLDRTLRGVLDTLPDPFLVLDPDGRVLFANRHAATLFGPHAQGNLAWSALPESAAEALANATRRAVREQRAVRHEAHHPGEPLGRWYEVEVIPNDHGVTVQYRDITDRRLAASRAEDLAFIASALGSATTLNDVASTLTGRVRETIGAYSAVLYALDEDGQHLRQLARTGTSAPDAWHTIGLHDPHIPALVALDGEPRFLTEADFVRDYPTFPRAPRTRAAAVLPLRAQEQLLGVLAYSYAHEPAFEDAERTFLLTIGRQAALALERTKLAQSVQMERDRYRELLDNVPQIVWTVDRDGRIEQFNQRWQDFTGMPLIPTGDEWKDILHPEDRAHGLAERTRRIAAGEPYAYESRLRRQDGEYRWALVQAQPVRDPATGEVRGWVGGATDIHERRQAEETLRELNRTLEERVRARTRELEQERRFLWAMLESLNEGIAACDAEGRLTVFNRATRELHGLPEEPLPPDHWAGHYRLLRPDGVTPLPTEEIPLYRAFSGEQVQDAEMRIRTLHGDLRTVLSSGNPILGANGEKLGAVVAMRDVTEQRTASAQLEASNRDLERANTFTRLLLDSAGEGVFGVDMQGLTTFANPAALKMIGYAHHEIVGFPQHALVHHTHPDGSAYPASDCPIYASRLDGQVRHVENEVFWRKDGTSFPVEYVSTPLRAADGTPEGAVVVFRDVTERRRAEEELRRTNEELQRSNAELERFAYVASHDLQEPLRTIAGFTEILNRRYGDALDDSGRKYLSFVTRGAERMKVLIDDLLVFSRLNSVREPLKPVPAEESLRDALFRLSASIEAAGARVTHDPLPTVMGDAGELALLFQNLVGNAVKFRREHVPPEVHVGAWEDGDRWHFTVRDNGIGVEAKYRERVFELFQRLNVRDRYEGTGLGLAIVRKIVERHGGQTWLDSEVGAGTTVHFTLPKASLTDG